MPSTLQQEGEPAAENKQAYDSREGDLWQSGLDSPTEKSATVPSAMPATTNGIV
jgi:hypothetical protein